MAQFKLGPLYWISILLMLIMTVGVVWLGVIAFETLFILLIGAILGIMAVVLAASAKGGKVAVTSETIVSERLALIFGAGLLFIIAYVAFLHFIIGIPMFAVTSTGGFAESIIVGSLFAFYEEHIIIGVVVCAKSAGVPDIATIIITTIFFIPLHAWVRKLDIVYSSFLAVGRATMTAQYAYADHTDPGIGTHWFWNVITA